MKKIKWFAVLFCLFASCQKNISDNSSNARQNNQTIVGQWEWFLSTFPYYATPLISRTSWGLKFGSDSTCISTGNFFPAGTGNYSLKEYDPGFPVHLPYRTFHCSLSNFPNLYNLTSPGHIDIDILGQY
ncbi:MAG: hypothetical protein JJE22_19080 [Bacteroidia bacterium]|nr:hypothetical protein [Bacteroidia bacterium]